MEQLPDTGGHLLILAAEKRANMQRASAGRIWSARAS